MLKEYLMHLYCVVAANKDIKVGLGSSATGVVSYKVGEAVNTNTVWEFLAHLLLILSIVTTMFTLYRGWHSFQKDRKRERLEQLKIDRMINDLQAGLNSEIVEE